MPTIESLKSVPLRFRFPELLVSIGVVAFLFFYAPTPIYRSIFLGLLVSHGIFLLVVVLLPKLLYNKYRFAIHLCYIILFTLTIGLLQLNYFPSLCLWLLLFYRLMVSKRQHIMPFCVIAIMIVGIMLGISFATLPKLTLPSDTQSLLNQLSTGLTAVAIGIQLWYLLLLAQHFRLLAIGQQTKVLRLVSTANKLTRFLPPQIWQPIIRTNQPIAVTNQRKKLTLLFSDIVGFTELSDTLSSDNLADILNTYLDSMTRITQKHGATLDKFIGDGMLCFFGDHQSAGERNDALKCAAMAIEMRQTMQVLRNQWRLLGFEGLHIRIGINTGYCHVGNFGSSNRMTYTVIGKEANLAARLEAVAEKSQILISETTFNLISHEYPCQLVGERLFKGFKTQQPVWELLDPNEENTRQSEWIDYNLSGFNLHLNFKDIKNYDERTIRNSLTHALEMLDKSSKLHDLDDQ